MRWVTRHPEVPAAWLAAIFAIVAAAIAYLQLESSRDLQLKTIAQDSFREYLKLAIDEPLFAIGMRTCSRDSCKNPEQSYEWFVSYFLHAAEQVYLEYPEDEGWKRALSSQVCFHREYLSSPDFVGNTSKHHDPGFATFIATTLPTCPPKPDSTAG